MAEPTTTFPIGSSVLLRDLVKGAHLNGKKGIVKSNANDAGRQEVYVFEAQRSMSVRPDNLRYEPRELSSLSVPEMRGVLRLKDGEMTEAKLSGMDKEEMRELVKSKIETEDPEMIAELVAKANEPKQVPAPASASAGASFSSSQLRQGAERMASMSPEAIRQQAATMRAMGPAALRNMNPQMARMSGEF